ncbi:hypothetical protein [Marinobacterium aestuariivivens]|uniref:Uncharacterized protein n=1 Tax=Marinobacterium aestuariivivens TaxID=1698799 RepID=A0ABW2AB37_9GAMM
MNQEASKKNKFQDFKLIYNQGGRRLERIFSDTLYANVKRVADSFPPTIVWRIELA